MKVLNKYYSLSKIIFSFNVLDHVTISLTKKKIWLNFVSIASNNGSESLNMYPGSMYCLLCAQHYEEALWRHFVK